MTKDFKAHEFVCKCGCGLNNIKINFVKALQLVRNKLDLRIDISSGCRCLAHNKKEGGSNVSSHLEGWAADIVIPNSAYAFKIMQAIFAVGLFNRIGFGKKDGTLVLHLDMDPYKPSGVLWGY